MIFKGKWLKCDDGATRPVIFAGVIGADGMAERGPFLIDTAADRTAISAELLGRSKLIGVEPSLGDRLGPVW